MLLHSGGRTDGRDGRGEACHAIPARAPPALRYSVTTEPRREGKRQEDCFCVFGPSSGVDQRRRRRHSLIALSPRPTWFSQQIGEGGACKRIGLPAHARPLRHAGGGVTNFPLMFTQSSDPVRREEEKGKHAYPSCKRDQFQRGKSPSKAALSASRHMTKKKSVDSIAFLSPAMRSFPPRRVACEARSYFVQ